MTPPLTVRAALAAAAYLVVVAVASSSLDAQTGGDAPESAQEPTAPAKAPKADKPPPIAADAKRPKRRPRLTSGLGVPPGETFHLGERETGDFIVSAYNRGRTPVVILATRGKRLERVGVVKPKQTVVRQFKTGDGVLVRNESKRRPAKLTVEVWGTQNLAMYYVPNEKEREVPPEEKRDNEEPSTDAAPAEQPADR